MISRFLRAGRRTGPGRWSPPGPPMAASLPRGSFWRAWGRRPGGRCHPLAGQPFGKRPSGQGWRGVDAPPVMAYRNGRLCSGAPIALPVTAVISAAGRPRDDYRRLSVVPAVPSQRGSSRARARRQSRGCQRAGRGEPFELTGTRWQPVQALSRSGRSTQGLYRRRRRSFHRGRWRQQVVDGDRQKGGWSS